MPLNLEPVGWIYSPMDCTDSERYAPIGHTYTGSVGLRTGIPQPQRHTPNNDIKDNDDKHICIYARLSSAYNDCLTYVVAIRGKVYASSNLRLPL